MKDRQLEKELCLDIFQEMGNIGTGSALTALSSVMEQAISENLPKVMKLNCDNLLDTFEHVEESIMGVLFPFSGEISGMFLLAFEEGCVSVLLNHLLGGYANPDNMNEEKLSVIKEIANLMASSYFTAISAYTSLRIELSVPAISIDMTGALVLDTVGWFSGDNGDAVCIESSFSIKGQLGTSHMVLMLYQESAVKFLEALGGVV